MADLTFNARHLRDLVEPIAAGVYFAQEARDAYADLGIKGFAPGYFCSRGGCLGKAPWTVICAAFGVFKPAIVETSVNEGWATLDAAAATVEQLLEARRRGAEGQLARLLGEPDRDVQRATEILRSLSDGIDPAGRMLFAGLSALPWPGTPWGDLWRAADLVREHRGDGHIAAWIGEVDAVEINLLGELWWRMPLLTYAKTRGWSDEELNAGCARLEARGLVRDGAFTPEGEALRADIEHATDRAEREVLARVGDRTDELFGLLTKWSAAIVDGGGYPADPGKLTRK
jgi:hypothetical protein